MGDKFLDFIERIVNFFYALVPRRKPKSSALEQVKIVAHRGAHDNKKGLIENTMPAFDKAFELGCWGIELDVHQTADGVFVVHHDPDLKRLWGRSEQIAELNEAELKKLNPEIPLLSEVIEKHANHLHLFIELKNPVSDPAILESVLEKITPCKDYHLIALSENILESVSQFPQESLLLVSVHKNTKLFCEVIEKDQFGGLLGHYLFLRNKFRNTLIKSGKKLGVGFIESKNSLLRELNRDIKWVFTNSAAKTMTILSKLKQKIVDNKK